jgi:hypothetical protein
MTDPAGDRVVPGCGVEEQMKMVAGPRDHKKVQQNE